MSNNFFKSWSLRDIVSIIADLIAIGGLVVIVSRLLQGKVGLVTIILLILCIGFLWLSSFYIYVKRTTYTKWVGRLALSVIIAIPIVITASFAGWKYYQNIPSDKIIILIADFDGLDKKKYRVTGNIVEQLREATQKYPDVQVKALPETITYEKGSEYARNIGKEHKASIVLWGEYAVNPKMVQVTVHFEVLRTPRYLPLRQEKEILNVAVAQLESFQVQTRLSSQMTYLVLMTIGLARYEAEDYDGAIARLTDALNQKTPEQIIAPDVIYFYLGNAYHFKGNYNKAITNYDSAISLQPDAVTYNNRGNAHSFKGEYDLAVSDFNKAIEISPNFVNAYYNRGIAYYEKDLFDLAITDYNKAIEISPNYAEAYNNRGVVYYEKGLYDLAITDYNKAIEINPNFAEAYYNRGVVHGKKGLFDLAIADFNKAIEINPNFAEAYNNRGVVYYEKGLFDLAITDYNKAIEINPNYAGAYNNRGLTYSKKGLYDLAIADFNKAIEINPDYADAYNNRGIAQKLKGEKVKAQTDFKKVLGLTNDPMIRQMATQQLQELGVK